MKLVKLEIENFRQYINASIDFSDGITGLVGQNGAGKSTILEAISWALYGSPALRGTNDTVKSRAAQGGAKVSSKLIFELGGSQYSVVREIKPSGQTSAAFETNGKLLSTGMNEVTASVARLLGMDYQAFFTSFFTGQKQLEFMSSLEGRQRANMISKMLGYERISKARDKANEDKKGLIREIEGLERGMPDPDEFKKRKLEAQTTLQNSKIVLEIADKSRESARAEVDKLTPIKELFEQKSKRFTETSRRLELDNTELIRIKKRLKDIYNELSIVETKEKELAGLVIELSSYKTAGEEYKKQLELQKYEIERSKYQAKYNSVQERVNDNKRKLEISKKKLELFNEIVARYDKTKSEYEATTKKLSDLKDRFISDKRDVETGIKHLNAELEKIMLKKEQIENAGENGVCPTCERPLSNELPIVLNNFDTQINDIKSRINDLENKKNDFEARKAEIANLQAKEKELAVSVDEYKKKLTLSESLKNEIKQLEEETAGRIVEAEKIKMEFEKIPTGFDQERFNWLTKLKDECAVLREKISAVKAQVQRKQSLEEEKSKLESEIEIIEERINESNQIITELNFSQDKYDEIIIKYENSRKTLSDAEISYAQAQGAFNTAKAVLKEVEQSEINYKNKVELLKARKKDRQYTELLTFAFDKLRIELNDRIQPELEARTGELLSILTDGRYSVVEVDSNYNTVIRDDGELKPVISGGEDDIVNLALRLAISQMIADRAGQSFSLLVLDEVFGSLDMTRRDNLVNLLQSLKNRFEQIILITHIESIYDAVDNCLWVEFDEKTKTSRLIEKNESLEVSPLVV
ncbi:MAG: SMC family ATPase [Armatimonadota bacterium]